MSYDSNDSLSLSLNSSLSMTLSPNNIVHISTLVQSTYFIVSAVLYQFRANGSLSLGPTTSSSDAYILKGQSGGFIQRLNSSVNETNCYVKNYDNRKAISFTIWALGLNENQPMPAGCAIDASLQIEPMIKVEIQNNSNALRLRFRSAGGPHARSNDIHIEDRKCERSREVFAAELVYDVYGLYLDTKVDFTSMIASENVTLNGRKVCTVPYRSSNGVYVGRYPHKKILLNILVRNKTTGATSPYIPVITESCDNNRCVLDFDVSFVYLLLFMVFVMGMVLCVAGHKWFHYTQFVTGLSLGSILGYVLLKLNANMSLPALIGCALTIGLLTGIFLLLLWQEFGSQIACIFFVCSLNGYVIAAIISYWFFDVWTPIGPSWTSHVLIFFAPLFLTVTLLIYWVKIASILSTSLIGASAVIVVVSFFEEVYVFGNATIHFIFIRSLERFTDSTYTQTCFLPPYYRADMVLTAIWIVLLLCGVSIQCCFANQADTAVPRSPKPVIRPFIRQCNRNRRSTASPTMEGVENPSYDVIET